MKIIGVLLMVAGGLWCMASSATLIRVSLLPMQAKRIRRAAFPNESPNDVKLLNQRIWAPLLWSAVWRGLIELGTSLVLVVSGAVMYVAGRRWAVGLAVVATVLYVATLALDRLNLIRRARRE